jgi:hypothetical protein
MTGIQSALFDNKENEPDSYFASLLWPATGENLTRESFLRYRKTGGWVIRPATTPELVRAAILDPLTMIASDGILDGGKGHPRTAGTFARILAQYVREGSVLPLMDALRKMTLMPAQRLEKRVPAMRDKGRLRTGADADITVFDPATVRDASTYTQPALQSLGIRYVLVNGTVLVRDGKVQAGVAAGREIRAPIEQGPCAGNPSGLRPWVTSGGLGPTLRRQVDPRQRTPPAARVASGSGHNRPPAPSGYTGNRCIYPGVLPAAPRRDSWALARVESPELRPFR